MRSPSPPAVKLAPVDEEKVVKIVEVCDVSREEAIRVLDACHMDETMAIDRFLNGTEVATWSQVSKKKRPVQQLRQNSRGSPNSYNRDRRDHSHNSADQGNQSSSHRRAPRQYPNYSQRPRDNQNAPAHAQRRRPQSTGPVQPHGAAPDLTGERNPSFQKPSPTWKRSRDASPVHRNAPPVNRAVPLNASPRSTSSHQSPHAQHHNMAQNRPANGSSPLAANHTIPPAATIPSPVRSAAPNTRPNVNENAWADPSRITTPPVAKAWVNKDQSKGSPNITRDQTVQEKPSTPVTTARLVDSPAKKPALPSATVKRTFNYAAAAAAGTSHAKPSPITPKIPAQPKVNTIPVAQPGDESMASDPNQDDSKKRRARNPRKPRARTDNEILGMDAKTNGERLMHSPGSQLTEPFDSRGNSATQSPAEIRREKVIPATSAWGTPKTGPPVKEDSTLEDSSTAVSVASAAVIGGDQSAGDSLSLQFGSFALSGIDSVNWSAAPATADKKPEPVSSTIVSSEPAPVTSAPAIVASTAPAPEEAVVPATVPAVAVPTVPVPQPSIAVNMAPAPMPVSHTLEHPHPVAVPQDVRAQNHVASAQLPPVSSGAPGSGMFPMLPVGPGGSFAPPNYAAPYLMPPPLHGYSPAMQSYENGSELGSSRAPSLMPTGSLPLYDPATIPGISGNGKYAGIPGLGDMAGLQGVQTGAHKEATHGPGADMEKANATVTNALPAGMDPLAPPYMMGYPSMQYPMYTFPTGPYAPPPPGMGPGPSPFPYPPAGQVSSQGARGGFGFEDASAGLNVNSRNATGLGESMYTPAYLNSSMTNTTSQKVPNDGSYKPVRGNPGNGLAGMGMGGGMVHGVAYDYAGGMPGVSNGIPSNGGAPGSWNNRQHNTGRGESGNGPGPVSNQSVPGGSQNSNVYAAGPGAAGYWGGPQQGGYYSV